MAGGKKSRARTKLRRARDKRNRKDNMRAQYAAWRDTGINQKSKRSRANLVKQNIVRNIREINTGNLGDYKAHFEFNAPFLAHTLMLSDAGYRNQYTSKCPRQHVRDWIMDGGPERRIYYFQVKQNAKHRIATRN